MHTLLSSFINGFWRFVRIKLVLSNQYVSSWPVTRGAGGISNPEWKLAPQIPRYYVSLQAKGSVCCKWAEYTAAGGEIQVQIAVVFTSGGRRSDEVDGWIAKDNAVLHEIYRSVVTKRESSTAKPSVFKSVFIPILSYDR